MPPKAFKGKESSHQKRVEHKTGVKDSNPNAEVKGSKKSEENCEEED